MSYAIVRLFCALQNIRARYRAAVGPGHLSNRAAYLIAGARDPYPALKKGAKGLVVINRREFQQQWQDDVSGRARLIKLYEDGLLCFRSETRVIKRSKHAVSTRMCLLC
jgi:hypothetical protein